MGLKESVERVFGAHGVLVDCIGGFKPRLGQTTMAHAVAGAIENGGILVVEAGTGVGKTYAYLVPALLSGKRVLLSTATKTLQDQLFSRDIPRLVVALGVPARVSMLKGRGSYLCTHRLGFARHDLRALHPSAQADLAWIERWSHTTVSGDLAELVQLDERSPVIPLVTSTRENCQGGKCPHLAICHVNKARRDAMAADIVVINHHLFFADMNVRESGVAELLPNVHSVVFDEAHQLNAIGIEFLGSQLTTNRLIRYTQDLVSLGKLLVLTTVDWPTLVDNLQQAVSGLDRLLRSGDHGWREAWLEVHPPGMDAVAWSSALERLHANLQQVELVMRSTQEMTPELSGLRERASQLAADLNLFSQPVQKDWVRWVESGGNVKMVQRPLNIADAMCSRFIPDFSGGGGDRSLVFTSATLGHDPSLAQFLDSCGLQEAQVLRVPSPFDYKLQAAVYVPTNMPKPSEATHSDSVAGLVAQGASILGGRTLVLTTTLRAMRDIADWLRKNFHSTAGLDILMQGESSKRELMDRFGRAGEYGMQGAILVATASFWEGVDVPGDALQMVVIDKLPFPPPNDPLIMARSRNCEENGKSPFQHLHVPHAAIALRQGAGRLIRTEADRGILVVCDVRLIRMGYGRRILAALPDMQKLHSEDEFLLALHALTKVSTKAQ